MAGTIPSLSMSTQFDNVTGLPMAGGLLYVFMANTTTPQNAYQDTGLSIALPNPIPLNGAGRVPEFYLADGTVHIRLTNSAGVIQLESQNTLVIGPSAGGGGGGPAVDPTTIFQTGDSIWVASNAAQRTGWVRQNGLTIGNATSGATEYANVVTQALYTYLWTNFSQPSSNALCPVVGGVGASAAADYAANKQLTLPDMRSRGAVGLDAMGNIAANILQPSNIANGSTTTALSTGGEANHTLVVGELAAHSHGVTDPGHNHTSLGPATPTSAGSGFNLENGSGTTGTSTTGIAIDDAGGGNPHNNMQPFALGTWYMKL
jgi:microcystin-dependent protein